MKKILILMTSVIIAQFLLIGYLVLTPQRVIDRRYIYIPAIPVQKHSPDYIIPEVI
jgi:hypothetical protein